MRRLVILALTFIVTLFICRLVFGQGLPEIVIKFEEGTLFRDPLNPTYHTLTFTKEPQIEKIVVGLDTIYLLQLNKIK